MRYARITFCLCFVAALTQGCYHTYYAPNTFNTPLLTEQHDATVGATYISGIGHSGFDLQSVYSPVRYGAVMLNYVHLSKTSNYYSSTTGSEVREWSKIRMTEGGVGGYWPVRAGSFSLFAGYGLGENSHYFTNDAYANLKLRRLFIQPGYAVQNELLQFGIGLRVIRLDFPSGEIDYRISSTPEGEEELKVIRNIERDAPFWFAEWGGHLSSRIKPFTFGLYGVLSMHKGGYEYHFNGTTIGANLSFNLHEVLHLKKKKPAVQDQNLDHE